MDTLTCNPISRHVSRRQIGSCNHATSWIKATHTSYTISSSLPAVHSSIACAVSACAQRGATPLQTFCVFPPFMPHPIQSNQIKTTYIKILKKNVIPSSQISSLGTTFPFSLYPLDRSANHFTPHICKHSLYCNLHHPSNACHYKGTHMLIALSHDIPQTLVNIPQYSNSLPVDISLLHFRFHPL